MTGAAPSLAAERKTSVSGPGVAAGGIRWERYLWVAVYFVLYCACSLLKHRELATSGWDLGIFEQAVRGYAEFRGPISDIKGLGFNLLGDHFHPILVVLVPAYWIYPDATTLLVAQAALIALSIFPIHRLATTLMGRWRASAVVAAYGMSFGIQAAVGFDFHEVAFAAPLLAFGLVALVEQRWLACVAWTVPLLLVKEDFGLYLAAIGVVLMVRGQRRVGAALAAGGLAAFALVVAVAIPFFNPDNTNLYFGYFTSGPQGTEYLVSGPQGDADLAGALLRAPWHLVDSPDKLKTIFLVAAVTGLIGLRSPIMLIALVNLVIRFEGNNPYFWTSFSWHYGLVLMPIVFIAYLDAYPRLRRVRIRMIRPYVRWSPLLVLVLAVGLSPKFPLTAYLAQAAPHARLGERQHVAYEMMARIPDGALVHAANVVAPHLTSRCDVVMWPFTQVDTDWVLADTTDPFYGSRGEDRRVTDLQRRGYVVVDARAGFILLRAPDS